MGDKELSEEGLANLLFAVGKARQHVREGDHKLVQTNANDEALFARASKRIIRDKDQFDVKFLADIIHTHSVIGVRDEPLFKALCPCILAGQTELQESTMAKVIKAYARFMIPLKEEAQGFRTMAVVVKGDFIRPSEKPKRTGKRTYDHPQSLYEKTQVHARS